MPRDLHTSTERTFDGSVRITTHRADLFRREPIVTKSDIRLLILDVDGVLTDGSIYFDDEGRQVRRYHIQDGLGLRMWKSVGGQLAILTSKRSVSIEKRAEMLGITLVAQGADDKLPAFERLLATAKVSAEQAAYIGDDLLDLVVMRRVAYPIAVANAVNEVKEVARYVTTRSGGSGAVREAAEHLLHQQGLWAEALRRIGADR